MSLTRPAPRRILIVRLSALGDIVMASGLIPALHARFPKAEISWVCEPVCAPLLAHNPRLKQVITWPRGEWQAMLKARRYMALWRAMRAFRTRLRDERFDLVLDGQGLLKSGLVAWFTGAPRRVSIIAREGSRRLMHEVVTPPPGADPVMGSEYRYLAHHLGAPQGSFVHDLAVGEAQRVRARKAARDGAARWQAGWLKLAVYDHSKAAQKFYKRLGFEPARGMQELRLDPQGVAELIRGIA